MHNLTKFTCFDRTIEIVRERVYILRNFDRETQTELVKTSEVILYLRREFRYVPDLYNSENNSRTDKTVVVKYEVTEAYNL